MTRPLTREVTVNGVTAHDLELSSATLEDACIQLTGHRAAPVPGSGAQSRQQDRSAQRKGSSLLPSQTPRRAFAKLTQAEARLAWRRPIGLAFGLAVPLLLLALFGAIPSFRHNKDLGGLTVVQLYFPGAGGPRARRDRHPQPADTAGGLPGNKASCAGYPRRRCRPPGYSVLSWWSTPASRSPGWRSCC
jgi:hypothetical protein